VIPTALTRLLQDSRVRAVLSVLQKVVGLAAIFFIARELSHIGWRGLWVGLPSNPAFYAAFVMIYALGPCVDALIYSRLWGASVSKLMPVFFRKRIYNESVFDYSGEAYLYLWARRHIALDPGQAASTIKDVTLLSGAASNVVTLVLLSVFIASGHAAILRNVDSEFLYATMAAVILMIAIPLLLFVFRGKLLAVGGAATISITGAHTGRIVLILALQVAQWSFALPQVPPSQWFLFLTAQMLVTRLPFLPNRDIVLMSLGVALAPLIAAPQNHVATMFVIAGALSLITHALILAATAVRRSTQSDLQLV